MRGLSGGKLKRHEKTPKDTKMPKLKELKKIHKEAIRLRYEGNTEEEIVEKLAVQDLKTTANTLKTWFRTGGLLDAEYQQYCERETAVEAEIEKVVKSRSEHKLKKFLGLAVDRAIASLGSKSESVGLEAAWRIIKQILGEPVQKTHITYEQVIKELEREEDEYKRELESKS